jgi:hypothetical protein
MKAAVNTGCSRGRRLGDSFERKAIMKINVVLSVLITFTISPMARAVSPAPDGGYPGLNTAEGQNALLGLTTGTANTAVGWFSLKSNTDGTFNTAVGAATLLSNVGNQSTGEGMNNTAIGAAALLFNTTGFDNTAVGAASLLHNIGGGFNTATGVDALFTNTTGQGNTATGAQALFFNDGDPTNNEASFNSAFGNNALSSNTTGYANSAFGSGALDLNNSGSFNTACGFLALGGSFALGDGAIPTGNENTAIGAFSLSGNIQGFQNTAVGYEALLNNTNGSDNAAVGPEALSLNAAGSFNTAIGHQALVNNNTGSGNVGVGENAGVNVTTASNVICIGTIGGENIDNTCYIANIYSNAQPVNGTDPDYVTIASNGKLGRSNLNGSSRRFKHDIHPMDKASEVVFALKPVRFRYNKEYDSAERPSFGLIAEEVAQVDPDLVGRNRQGDPESVRYEQVNAMLLNEFLKEHKKVQQLEAAFAQQRNDFEAAIAELKQEIRMVAARSNKQNAEIQRASARVELKSPATNVVLDNR